jgi:hypothetical protein
MATITSANSSFALRVPGVFFTPQLIQGYAADDAFTQEAFDLVETRMGVDGNLSGGYVPSPKKLTIMLMPDSSALDTFILWAQAHVTGKDAIIGGALIALPSINKAFTLGKVFFTNWQGMPSAKKVLDPVQAVLTYQDLTSAPI